MSRQRKVQIFLALVVVLYLFSTTFGLARDDGAMGAAMKVVRKKISDGREKIQKEMDKPFILRLFGSASSMEKNTFESLKEELPEILANALPDELERYATIAPPSHTACAGMRLADALNYLAVKGVRLEKVSWGWDPAQFGPFIKLGGTVLAAEETGSGGVHLVLQYIHPYDGEDGIGETEEARRSNLDQIAREVAQARERPMLDWLSRESPWVLYQAVQQGYSLSPWCSATVEAVTEGPFVPPAAPRDAA
ncbi:MAG: hypothetical protein AAF604_05320 [Acidobacteriota bacterium]